MPHLIQPGAGEHSTHRSAAGLRDQADHQSDEGLECGSGEERAKLGKQTGQRARCGGAGRHRRITLTRTVHERSMLSRSHPKIHEPRVTGVSPVPRTSDSARKTAKHEEPCRVPELGHGLSSAVSSCGLVLVDTHRSARRGPVDTGPCGGPARGQATPGAADAAAALDAAAGCLLRGIRGEDPGEVPLAEDQRPVGELGSDGQHDEFGEAIRPRTTGRNPDYLDARIRQHRVERGRELTGPIPDEEPEPGGALAEVQHKVAGLLGRPRPVRCPVTPRTYR